MDSILLTSQYNTKPDGNVAKSAVNINGSARKILWDAPTSDPSTPSTTGIKITFGGSGLNISGDVTIS